MKFFQVLRMLGAIVPNVMGVLDEDASIEERGKDLLKVLEFLAEQTATELDDDLIDKLSVLTQQPEFWLTLEKVVLLFSEDDSDVVTKFGALQKDRDMDPATIMLIIEVVGMLVKLWRDRRD